MAITGLIRQPSCFILANMSRAESPTVKYSPPNWSVLYFLIKLFAPFLWIPMSQESCVSRFHCQSKKSKKKKSSGCCWAKLWESLPSAWLKPVKAAFVRFWWVENMVVPLGEDTTGCLVPCGPPFLPNDPSCSAKIQLDPAVELQLKRFLFCMFFYVFCSVCPAILGDAIKEKLHLQTLCDSAGWLRHFRGLTATA